MTIKATDIYKFGVILSGISGDEECPIAENENTPILFYINKALSDLNIEPLNSINEELNVSPTVKEALTAGVAYYLSLCASYSNRVSFLSDMYNAKRATALSCIKTVKNTMPIV